MLSKFSVWSGRCVRNVEIGFLYAKVETGSGEILPVLALDLQPADLGYVLCWWIQRTVWLMARRWR